MVLNMNRLPKQALDGFNSGLFVAKLANGSFNSVWIDYVLEVTENKALKSSGGIIGLTHQNNALARWFLSRPVTAEYSMTYKGNMHQEHTQSKHHTNTAYYKKAFNLDISKRVEIFDETFIDPFSISNLIAFLLDGLPPRARGKRVG